MNHPATPPVSVAGTPLVAPAFRWGVRMAPGVALSGLIAWAAMWLGGGAWAQAHGLSALTLAIIIGMVIGNTVFPRIAASSTAGVNFSKQRLLRTGVVLYGLRLTMQDVGLVGLAGVAIDALVIGSTFLLACLLGVRWLGLDRKISMLIGVGAAVCGAAAVMGAEPVVRARAEQVTVAISTVVVFGTVSIFLYPVLFDLNALWQFIPGGTHGFGVYTGSTIHEVAQVVAAGRAIGPDAAGAAVIAKMVRVMMLAPFLILLSAWLARDDARGGAADGPGDDARKMTIPWFAFGFVAVVLINSLQVLSPALVEFLVAVDTVLLAMAMAALGLSTHLSAIRKAGLKPLVLAACLFVWLVAGGAVINRVMVGLLG